ncbi:MAG TPA: UDP-3-O-(3-hydroxymyristoyl)glucosamine N-acyltransferase [Phycisphaerales bacterium]|nr:UDP-3-O-(3-hydroxymyristoyl)glucosamine N-acyltransferase [Phycisphaerales bacterium]HMP37313.1 UDP-3-O-(3-hydroxymyristoyl)glucosamine N-acyltransferase [Phycisphaerales bacterium]
MAMTLAQLADRIGAVLSGDAARLVAGCASIERAGPDEVAFVANPKYAAFLRDTRAAAVIVGPRQVTPDGLARLEAPDPYFAFREAMMALHGLRTHPPPMGGGTRHETASIGEGCEIHPHAVVERHAALGPGCVLYPGAYVGEHARLGAGCVLYPNAVVYDRCVLGDRVTLHANAVVGHDGFGYATHGGVHHKIPQAGVVVVEDDVELGAGCAIERAAMGETRIGAGTKFADLISIGHGTTIGRHCLFVSLVGVSGSVDVGDYVVLGGQVGVTGHLTIGDFVQAAGKAAIVDDVPPKSRVGGVPAIDLDAAKRNALVGRDLYGMARRLRALEREVERLRAASARGSDGQAASPERSA